MIDPLKIILVAASRRHRHGSERCAGLAAMEVVAGTVFCLSNPASPRLEKGLKVHHASLRPEHFHEGQFLAGVDEFCQDFIWFSPDRLYPVQACKALLSRNGAALIKTAASPVPASAIRGIGWFAPHKYQIDRCGVSNWPRDLAAYAGPFLGG